MQFSCYAFEIVRDMRRQLSLFVGGLGRTSSKEGRASMLIRVMEILWLIVYVQ